MTVANLLYIVIVGGDHFNERFLIHALPLILCMLAAFLETSAGLYASASRSAQVLPRIAQYSLLGLLGVGLWTHPPTFPLSTHLTGWRVLGEYLRTNSRPDDLLATDAAGAIPYYSGLKTIDVLGLTDIHIAHKNIKTMGQGAPGHEKQDNAYVLSRNPRYISTWLDADGGAGRNFKKYFEFRSKYELKVLLDTSRSELCSDRLMVVQDYLSLDRLLKLVSRTGKKTGVFDWGLYERRDRPLESVELNAFDFNSNLDSGLGTRQGCIALYDKESGKEGHLLYGPYMRFTRGEYAVALRIVPANAMNLRDIQLPVANFDILAERTVRAERAVRGSDFMGEACEVVQEFTVTESDRDAPFEFRLYVFARADLRVTSVRVWRVGT